MLLHTAINITRVSDVCWNVNISWTSSLMWLDRQLLTTFHRRVRLLDSTFFVVHITSPTPQYSTASQATVIMKSCIFCVKCSSSTLYVLTTAV